VLGDDDDDDKAAAGSGAGQFAQLKIVDNFQASM
jgi:hypothetical protein